MVTTFVGLDAAVGALTGNGASRISNSSATPSERHIGQTLLKVALILQIACMLLFIGIAAKFQFNCRRAGVENQKLRAVLITLYCSCLIITCRTIYRTVEYFAAAAISTDVKSPYAINPILRHEWFFWIFEAVLMLANSVLMNARHPLRYLPRSNKIYLDRDGVTEIEGPGYSEKRLFIITLLDPFDIIGLIRGKDKQSRFWEAQGG